MPPPPPNVDFTNSESSSFYTSSSQGEKNRMVGAWNIKLYEIVPTIRPSHKGS